MFPPVYQTTETTAHGGAALPTHPELHAESDRWLVQSRSEDGLNLYYQLYLVPPQGRAYHVNLPWQAQQTCPHCQGEGVIYGWNEDNSAYHPTPCQDCLGQGSLNHDSEINLTINDGLGGQRVIRKSRAGRFNARLGLRGDLILNLTWVDNLPRTTDDLPAAGKARN